MNKGMKLEKFKKAHETSYERALLEIRNGRKESHWMWYIFPQIKGLGRSSTAQYYAIESLKEAEAFLEDEYLGKNLIEITEALLELDSDNPTEVMGVPDDMKLKSSMTLFELVAGEDSVFSKVLQKYFNGNRDRNTLRILGI